MTKSVVFSVILGIIGITVAIVSISLGSLKGFTAGLVFIIACIFPVWLLILHTKLNHMPAYIELSYRVLAFIPFFIWMIIGINRLPSQFSSHPNAVNFIWYGIIISLIGFIIIGAIHFVALINFKFSRAMGVTIDEIYIAPAAVGMYAALFAIIYQGFFAVTGGYITDFIAWSVMYFFAPYIIFIVATNFSKTLFSWGENRAFREATIEGRGGSARWAGPDSLSKNKIKYANFSRDTRMAHISLKDQNNGIVYLGATLAKDTSFSYDVGVADDAHMITIGMTGAGKSTTALFNTLPTYKGSVLAIDPKGELADYAVKHRYFNLKKTPYVLDPFDSSSLPEIYKAGFNPLSIIDIDAPDARRFLQGISDAIVINEGERNLHWTESAKTFIEGLIVHVLSTEPKQNHHLPFLHDMLLGLGNPDEDSPADINENFKRLITEMSKNYASGNIVVTAANSILRASDEGYGALLSTVQRSLKWIGDPQMRKQLNPKNDLRALNLRNLGRDAIDIYIVLPFDYLNISVQGRWARLLVNMGMSCVQVQPTPPSPQVLFIADEFYSLGHIKRIEEGIVQLRSAGVKFWLFIQNLGQLKGLYGANWETFIGASNMQVLPINDPETANWVAARIGQGRNGKPLVDANEVSQRLSKGQNRQIVFPVSGFPMQLATVFYQDLIPSYHHGMFVKDMNGYTFEANEENTPYLYDELAAQQKQSMEEAIPQIAPKHHKETKNSISSISAEIEQLVEEWGYEGDDIPEDINELEQRYNDRKKQFPASMQTILTQQYDTLSDVFFS